MLLSILYPLLLGQTLLGLYHLKLQGCGKFVVAAGTCLRRAGTQALRAVQCANCRLPSDPVATKLSEMIGAMRVQNGRRAAIGGTWVATALVVMMITQHHKFGSRPLPEQWREVLAADVSHLILGAFLCLCFAAFPWLVTERSLDGVQILIAAYWVVRVACYRDLSELVYRGGSLASARFFASIFLGNAPLATAVNFTVTTYEVYRYRQLFHIGASGCLDTAFVTLTPSVQFYFIRECVMVASITLCTWLAAAFTRAQVRAALAAMTSAQAETTAHRLLSAMCDAVVKLGPDLRLLAPSPKLAALLLRPHMRDGFCGGSLLDLVCADDRESVRSHLGGGPACGAEGLPPQREPPEVAPTFGARFRDANGSQVPVQLYYSRFSDCHHPACCVVGIRECEEAGGRAVPDCVAPGVARQDLPPGPTRIGAALSGSGSGSASPSGSALSFAVDDADVESGGEITVWVDCFTDELDILQCSPSFAALGGRSSLGVGLLPWFVDHKDFKEWVQDTVNMALSQDPVDLTPRRMTLRPPGMTDGAQVMEFSAECSLRLDAVNPPCCEASREADHFPLCVALGGVARRNRRRQRQLLGRL